MGLIPAYAGRTGGNIPFSGQSEAHPRLRGADYVQGPIDDWRFGSSPLTRGGLPSHQKTGQVYRLIPAYAGRTLTDQRGRAKNEASRSDL